MLWRYSRDEFNSLALSEYTASMGLLTVIDSRWKLHKWIIDRIICRKSLTIHVLGLFRGIGRIVSRLVNWRDRFSRVQLLPASEGRDRDACCEVQ